MSTNTGLCRVIHVSNCVCAVLFVFWGFLIRDKASFALSIIWGFAKRTYSDSAGPDQSFLVYYSAQQPLNL